MRKISISAVALTFILGLMAVFPVQADGGRNVEITWLSDDLMPCTTVHYSDSLNLIPVKDKSDRHGFVDPTGAVVIPVKYDSVDGFCDGLASVGYKESDDSWKSGFIDSTGREVIPLEYEKTDSFSEGLATVARLDNSGDWKVGVIDTTGKVVVPLDYFMIGSFSEGMAVVSENALGPCGYIDKTGKVTIALDYEYARGFSEGLAAVATEDYKWGFIDKNGKQEIPFTYDDVGFFNEGMAAVCQKNGNGEQKWGFINTDGEVMVPLEYDEAWGFNKGTALVGRIGEDGQEEYALIDTKGTLVIPFGECAGRLAENLVATKSGAKYGIKTVSGEEVLPPEYDAAYSVADGRYGCVHKGASYGVFENPYYPDYSVRENGESAVPNETVPAGQMKSSVPLILGITFVCLSGGAAAIVLLLRKRKK